MSARAETMLDWVFRSTLAMDPRYRDRLVVSLATSKGEKPAAGMFEPSDPNATKPPYTLQNGVATLAVYGVITKREMFSWWSSGVSCDEIRASITAALNDTRVKSIVLDVDSPGGSVDGVADLSEFIFDARGRKPITAYANGQMASAAYFIASAADKIITSQDASVGSIGVYSILCDYSEYLKTLGINEEMIKAGKFKGLGHPDFPITPDTRKLAQEEVDAHYQNFVAAVARNRGMTIEDATKVADGRHHVGAAAVKLGLADEVGTIEDANGTAHTPTAGDEDSPKKIQPRSDDICIAIPQTNSQPGGCGEIGDELCIRF